ncbi:MAG TPA: hypothetical protein VFV66_27155, partial [Nonomuraea sp.]|nr:hypothetical protein [Nonomuraea sp.]
MLEAYQGWHMHHPIDIRISELFRALRNPKEPVSAREVFSTAPGTPFRISEFEPYVCQLPELSAHARQRAEMMVWRKTWADTLLND